MNRMIRKTKENVHLCVFPYTTGMQILRGSSLKQPVDEKKFQSGVFKPLQKKKAQHDNAVASTLEWNEKAGSTFKSLDVCMSSFIR